MIETAEYDKVTRAQAERWKPAYVYEPVSFRTKSEAFAYRDREYQRWEEGYNGISGWHYKWLTQYKIKNALGQIIRPQWRDGDQHVVFKVMEDAMKKKDDKFTLKRREFGLSSIDGGFIPLEVAMRNPGCVIKLTSADEHRVTTLMSEKVETMSYYVFQDVEDEYRKISGSSGTLLRPKIKYTNSDMMLTVDFGQGVKSTIQGVQTSKGIKSSKKMEGERLAYAFIDEFFLHEFASKVRLSADAARNVGLSRAGIISLGGSAGDSTTDGIQAAQDLWYNHEKYYMQVLFLPGTLCIEKADEIDDRGVKTGREISFMLNGYSLQQEAYEWIGKVRKILYSLVDKSAYWQFVKQYPLYVEEVFETTGNDIWDEFEKKRFEQQKKRIYISPLYTSKPKSLMTKSDGSIEVRDSASSPVKIIIPPIPGHVYGAGIDPIPIVARKEAEGTSEYAIAIKDFTDNIYCAYYMEKVRDVERIVEKSIQLQKLYFNAVAMIERNRGDAVIQEYKKQGAWDLLAYEPVTSQSSRGRTLEKGYYKDVHNTDGLINNVLKWAREYNEEEETGGIESIWDTLLITQIETLHIGNKDLADAVVGAELLHNWYIERTLRASKMSNASSSSVKKVPVKVFQNGQIIIKFVEVQTSSTQGNIDVFGRTRYKR